MKNKQYKAGQLITVKCHNKNVLCRIIRNPEGFSCWKCRPRLTSGMYPFVCEYCCALPPLFYLQEVKPKLSNNGKV